jgi:prepilin-type N-terminal cleavage/methylation domain-containing protein
MKRKQAGFSLIELLIVVAIILIIAAIAIPSFLRSKMAASEASAVQTVRDINTAEAAYSIQFGSGFTTNIQSLGGTGTIATPTNALLLDPVASSGTKDGFTFAYGVTGSDNNGNPVAYSVNANPLQPGSTGSRWFFSDQSCVIRSNSTQAATLSDPAI